MVRYIVINGIGRSGKDTFADLVKDHPLCSRFLNISSIDPIKDIAISLGWDGEKDDTSRTMLSELKSLCNKYFDTSYIYIYEKINDFLFDPDSEINDRNGDKLKVIFIHIREPEEIEKFCKRYKNTCSLLITRPDIETPTNLSDQSVNDYHYNFIIDNSSTIEDLNKKVNLFLKILSDDNLMEDIIHGFFTINF